MQHVLGAVAVLFALALTPYALKVQTDDQRDPAPGAHFLSLAGEAFDVDQPGGYLLLRARDTETGQPLLDLQGTFSKADEALCALQLKSLTLRSKWLEGKVVHMNATSGFAIKVSNSPIGHWMPFENFTVTREGAETLPRTFIHKNEGFEFHVGPIGWKKRPVVTVLQNPVHKSFDVFLSNATFFNYHWNVSAFEGLLGTAKHNKTSLNRTAQCDDSDGKLRRRDQAQGSLLAAAWK